MPRLLFFSSLVLCLAAIALTQLPDPGVFGLHDESGRILFYGGFGLLAGLFGLVALISALLWMASGSAKVRYFAAILLMLAALVAIIVGVRLDWI